LSLFPFQSLITGVTVLRVHKQWELGGHFFLIFDQVSHPYKTTCKTAVLYILIFIYLDSMLEDKRFGME